MAKIGRYPIFHIGLAAQCRPGGKLDPLGADPEKALRRQRQRRGACGVKILRAIGAGYGRRLSAISRSKL